MAEMVAAEKISRRIRIPSLKSFTLCCDMGLAIRWSIETALIRFTTNGLDEKTEFLICVHNVEYITISSYLKVC